MPASSGITRDAITALILAGGRGRRMGGADKGLLPVQGKALARHVLEALRPQTAHLLFSANRNVPLYAALGAPVVTDPLAWRGAGPLAGIAAGLRACTTPWLLCAPCDVPTLPADLAARLAHGLREGMRHGAAPAAIACADGRRHPVLCLLHRDLLPRLESHLGSGARRVQDWMATLPCTEVCFDSHAEAPPMFDNINHPQDLLRLERAEASSFAPAT